MSRTSVLSVCASIVILAEATIAASAQGAPVTIDSCAPIMRQQQTIVWQTPPPSFMGVPIASTSSGMAITFVNESKTVATLVNFAVNDNGNHFVIRDVGTFSPGVTINHRYNNGSGQSYILPSFITPRVRCRVASVTFADGSVWRRGQRPTSAMPPNNGKGNGNGNGSSGNATLGATPNRLALDTNIESALFLVQSSAPVAGFREHDTCSGIATIYTASTGDTSATYAVRPLAPGTCSATVRDEAGASTTIPIAVR